MALPNESVITHITSFSGLTLGTHCILPVKPKDTGVIRPCKNTSSTSLEERQQAIELYEQAVSDKSDDAISKSIRDLLECCLCSFHRRSRINDIGLIDAICSKWKDELSISPQNEATLCVSSTQKVVSKVSEIIEICELPSTNSQADTDKHIVVSSVHESKLVEETTNMTTFSLSSNENTPPKQEDQETNLPADDAPVEGGDSHTSATTTPQVNDLVRQGTDEEICSDERDIGEDSTLIGMDSQALDEDSEVIIANDKKDGIGLHGRQRKPRLSDIKGFFEDPIKRTTKLIVKGGKRLVAKLEESEPDSTLNQTSAKDKTLKVELNVKVSSSTNLPLRPFDSSIPHGGMDGRQQEDGEVVKLNFETKIQAVASC